MTRLILSLALVAAACVGDRTDVPVTAKPGEPLPGLTEEQLARFETGKRAFTKVYTPQEGLGPLYTENSCNACHHEPETGGGGGEPDTHASRFVEPDSCDPMVEEGGFVRKGATPLMRPFAADRFEPPIMANGVEQFFAPPLYGHGLIEAIPEETITALADPDDENDDGISGRVSRLADGRLGRFRRKADRAAIHDLVEAGVRFAIGLTTPDHPDELSYRGVSIPPGVDPVADPEIDRAEVDAITDFVRFLAPPNRADLADEDVRAVVRDGERSFDKIGCADCHVQRLRTGPNVVAALDRKLVPLYSDLLLHDMGPGLAGVCGPTATPSELRTEILWGLRYRREGYMHNGKARSLEEAIALHDGEARGSRVAFRRLSRPQQEALIRFLQSL
jgi:CxxC motif-containing protein (DUF1111 family)